MRSKVPSLIVLLLIISFLPGCIRKENSKEIQDLIIGDIILSISMDGNPVNESPDSLLLRITLVNNCEHELEVDQNLSFGTNLNASIVKSDGSEVLMDLPGPSDKIEYMKLKPGENVSTTIDLVKVVDKIKTDGRSSDFYWQIPGEYWIDLTYNGTKNMLNITSNNFTLHLEEIDPLVDIIPPDSLPSIIMAHVDNITRYRYDGEKHEFIGEITIDADYPRSMIDKDGHYYFVVNDGIRKVDHDLSLVSEMYMEKMGVMVEKDGIFYFSANGSFFTCNSDLELLSSLDLNITTHFGAKIVHDIIIHENVAYLVDNILYPLYIFKVNVTDPVNISVIQRIEIMGVNHHLYHQWLDVEKDRWMIIQTGAIMTGNYEGILFYGMENGTEINYQSTYWISRNDWRDDGFKVRSILPINPTWCLTASGNYSCSNFRISNISMNNDEIILGDQLDLLIRNDTYVYSGTMVKQYGHIVYATVGNYLRVVDMSGDRKVIFGQTHEYYVSDLVVIT